MVKKRRAKLFIELEGDNRLRKLIQISAKDVGGIVNSVPSPIEALPVARRRIKKRLEFFDPLCGAAQAENSFDIGCLNLLVICSR